VEKTGRRWEINKAGGTTGRLIVDLKRLWELGHRAGQQLFCLCRASFARRVFWDSVRQLLI